MMKVTQKRIKIESKILLMINFRKEIPPFVRAPELLRPIDLICQRNSISRSRSTEKVERSLHMLHVPAPEGAGDGIHFAGAFSYFMAMFSISLIQPQ